ncbi:hypothetical protein D3C83_51280 [compost metagenome]
MGVGHHQARGIQDHAGTEHPVHGARLRRIAEEALEQRILEQGVLRRLMDAHGIDIDHGRGDCRHCIVV